MLLLQIIGTIGAITFLLLTRKKTPRNPKVLIRTPEGFLEEPQAQAASRDAYLREKEAWLVEHTDPLFGRPNDSPDVYYFEKARSSWDTKNVINEYRVPFKFSRDGFVEVITDEFPLLDQKFIFEWLVERMDEISVEVTKHLLNAPDDWYSREEAKNAFNPGRITKITMKGSEPVAWTIRFDTDIGEGEALTGTVLGKDQRVESAELSY